MRKRLFYPRLAANNLRLNARTFIPYLITSVVSVAMYYIIFSISRNEGILSMRGGEVLQFTLSLGTWVVAIFSVVFLFYTHSFLIKRRKKEFGLFNILGMEKKHISRIIFYETLYTALVALTVGIVLGLALSRLMHLLLLKMLHFEVTLGFALQPAAALATLALFGVIFLLTFLHSVGQIHLSRPIELLRGSETGEKEPRIKWLLLVVGLVSLGAGYYISITTVHPLYAMMLFFVAVVLVIIGTYCLFTTGSIALLKLLRRNKKYYYQTNHFISVSGMMYRMKQNAVGLANICILSTMVLVMISATSSLYIGMEDVMHSRYPREISIGTYEVGGERLTQTRQVVAELLTEQGLTAENGTAYRFLSFGSRQQGERFTLTIDRVNSYTGVINLCFLPLSDFQDLAGVQGELGEGEAYVLSNRTAYTGDHLDVEDLTFAVVPLETDYQGFNLNGALNADMVGTYFVVVRDWETLERVNALQTAAYGEHRSQPRQMLEFDLSGGDDVELPFYESLIEALSQRELPGSVESRAANRQDFYALYGGFFYLGLFLGILFLMATVLIIYYKQISEGYDDQRRFRIMRQVGLSRREVKRSIHSQILTMFFLPLVTAGIHVAFAFPVISRLLMVFNLRNTGLFALCTVGCFVVFTLFYAVIYALTARVYYRIVGEGGFA